MKKLALFELLQVPDRELVRYAEDELDRTYGSAELKKLSEAKDQKAFNSIDFEHPDDRWKKMVGRKIARRDYIVSDYLIYEMMQEGSAWLDKKARGLCVEKYSNFIWDMIHKYFESFGSSSDMFQSGVEGLLKALDNYCPYTGTGVDLPPYMTNFVYQHLSKQARFIQGVSMESHHHATNQKKLNKADPDYDNMDDAEIARLSRETGLSERVVRKEVNAKIASSTISVEAMEKSNLYIADSDSEDPVFDAVFQEITIKDLYEKMKKENILAKDGTNAADIVFAHFLDSEKYADMAKNNGLDRTDYSVPARKLIKRIRKKCPQE